jgi:anti-sigma B factor antagonist
MRRWWKKIVEDRASFTTLLSEAHGVPVLRVSGDIVLNTTEPQFRAALKKAVDEVERTEDAGRVLVVEFRDVTFLDSIALGTLVGETEELRKRGGEVRLVLPPGGRRVRRILEVTGLETMFGVYSDVLSAVEERQGGPTP